MTLADISFDRLSAGLFAHGYFELEIGIWQEIDHAVVIFSVVLVAVELIDASILLLKLKVQPVVIDHIALRKNIIFFLFLVLLHFQY